MPRKRSGQFALMDTAFLSDQKFLRLQRIEPDPMKFAAAVGTYWMLLAEARRAKSPDLDWTDWTEYDEAIVKLRAAGLVGESGFKHETFDDWAPAYQSPSDRRRGTQGYAEVRNGTQPPNDDEGSAERGNGYAEQHEGTQRYAGYIPIGSTPFSSSPSTSTSSEPEVVPSAREPEPKPIGDLSPETDAMDAYIVCTGRAPRTEGLDWLNRLAKDHGEALTAQQIIAEWSAKPAIGTLLSRVEARLVAAARRRDKAHDEAEQRWATAVVSTHDEQVAVMRAADPEADAKAAERRRAIREGLAASGLVAPTNSLEPEPEPSLANAAAPP